jgi:hypothetical protein
MSHPSLGLPPADLTAGQPEAAARLRASSDRLARLALENTLRAEAAFADTYDETTLRLFLRDYGQHIEQLARALETGKEGHVTNYAEWLVPIYRRRRVPMLDVMTMLRGLRDAATTVLSPAENDVAAVLFERWADRLKHHGRLPGDHKGNPIIRFFWKGAGIGDDKWV